MVLLLTLGTPRAALRTALVGTASLLVPLLAPPCLEATAQRAAVEEATGSDVSPDLAALRANLSSLLDDPALTRAQVGFHVVAAESGEVLFDRNGERRFTAASTSKLVTGAVALTRLGPDFTWETRLHAAGAVDGGVLEGDLWVIGGGDPTLGAAELERMARSVRAAGIERVSGDLVGDDRAFADAPWGRGWMWDALYVSFAAGVGALQVTPARISAELRPGARVGDGARLVILDTAAALPIRNEVRTGAPGSRPRLSYRPDAAGPGVALVGWIPRDTGPLPLAFAPPHPTGHFLRRFRAALSAAGVQVAGASRTPRREEAPGSGGWQREFDSAPLRETLDRLLKSSDNQLAETLLRTLGTIEGDGSAADGIEIVEATLAEWGIEPEAYAMADGSGLSRYNEMAPTVLTRLLRRMSRVSEGRLLLGSLPVAGRDGTLARRFAATAARGRVRAKTVSLTGVRGLAGTVEDGDGETLVFALLLNGYDAPDAVAAALQDLLIEQLALYHGPEYPEARARPPR